MAVSPKPGAETRGGSKKSAAAPEVYPEELSFVSGSRLGCEVVDKLRQVLRSVYGIGRRKVNDLSSSSAFDRHRRT